MLDDALKATLSRKGRMLAALQCSGLSFGFAMLGLGGMYEFSWSIGVAAGIGGGLTMGLSLASYLEHAIRD